MPALEHPQVGTLLLQELDLLVRARCWRVNSSPNPPLLAGSAPARAEERGAVQVRSSIKLAAEANRTPADWIDSGRQPQYENDSH